MDNSTSAVFVHANCSRRSTRNQWRINNVLYALGGFLNDDLSERTTEIIAKTSASADLSVTASATPNPVTAGSNLTYTLTVLNAGPSASEGVTLSETLPGSVTFVSSSPSIGGCSGTGSILCNLGTLNSGASATITLVVTPTSAGDITDSAVVTGSTPDPNAANNSATATVSVSAAATGAGSAGGTTPPPSGEAPPPTGGTPPPAPSSSGGGGCALGTGTDPDASFIVFFAGGVLFLLLKRRKNSLALRR